MSWWGRPILFHDYIILYLITQLTCAGGLPHGKFELLSLGKASSHSTEVPIFVLPVCSVFVVSIAPAVRHTLLPQMDMGCLTWAKIWVRAVHTKGGQAQTNLRKCWLVRKDKLFLTLPRHGIEPRVFGFEIRLSNHRAMRPVWFGQRERPQDWPASYLPTWLEGTLGLSFDSIFLLLLLLLFFSFVRWTLQSLRWK